MKGDYDENWVEGVPDEGANAGPRAELKPSTVETIRDQLEFQRDRRPSWIAYHFPEIDRRGMPVDYEDVDRMSERQADSVRHLLASAIVYGRGRVRKRKAMNVGLASDQNEQPDEWAVRLRQLEEALLDVCTANGLPSPL